MAANPSIGSPDLYPPVEAPLFPASYPLHPDTLAFQEELIEWQEKRFADIESAEKALRKTALKVRDARPVPASLHHESAKLIIRDAKTGDQQCVIVDNVEEVVQLYDKMRGAELIFLPSHEIHVIQGPPQNDPVDGAPSEARSTLRSEAVAASQAAFVDETQSKLNRTLEEIIRTLRGDKTKNQPTKLEKIIDTFRRHPGQNVALDELLPLFEGTYNAQQAARNLLVKLNAKLERHGFRVVPVASYAITQIDKTQQ